ncbi:MAG: uroporphyrinogen decarboxylase [Deltaproteobacteria bacterium]|nr:uroporphyrinogen decarboxylase [Deltaproteobacteria bacterium]
MSFPIPSLDNDLLLRAINHQEVPRVPVWMMRQAGRADPDYLAYREKAGLTLYELFRAPEHAIPISLLPRRFGVDAIIMYQDILTPLEPMGAVFHFTPGPVLAEPVRHVDHVKKLNPFDPSQELPYVEQTIKGLNAELSGSMPLLGFAGSPFTLAAFMVEGKSPGKGMVNTFALLDEQPEAFADLMDRLTRMTIDYLNYQKEMGVHAVQLFESVGDQIPRDVYERVVQPSHERIFSELRADLPGILFVRDSPFPDLMLKSGAAVLSMGAGADLRSVLDAGGGKVAVQGNVDNRLLAGGTPDQVADAVRDCLARTGGRGHILNLSHGLLPETPFENVLKFVETAINSSNG